MTKMLLDRSDTFRAETDWVRELTNFKRNETKTAAWRPLSFSILLSCTMPPVFEAARKKQRTVFPYRSEASAYRLSRQESRFQAFYRLILHATYGSHCLVLPWQQWVAKAKKRLHQPIEQDKSSGVGCNHFSKKSSLICTLSASKSAAMALSAAQVKCQSSHLYSRLRSALWTIHSICRYDFLAIIELVDNLQAYSLVVLVVRTATLKPKYSAYVKYPSWIGFGQTMVQWRICPTQTLLTSQARHETTRYTERHRESRREFQKTE